MVDLKLLDYHTFTRLRQISSVLFEHELHHLLIQLGLRTHLSFRKKIQCKLTPFSTQPETIRKVFEDLGGAFVKLGQLLALRPDLVGEDYSREFEKLLQNVPPENIDSIKKAVAHIPFTNFSSTPLGSGSIAQVHKAKLHGKWVAVKIKRPNVDKQFRRDIRLMALAAQLIVEKYNPSFMDPIEIVNEFKQYTEKELNLEHEAANIRRFTKHFKDVNYVKIPQVHEEYSSESVLIMDYVVGIPVSRAKKNKLIVDRLTGSLYKMLFEDRFFHADLHPGNILLDDGKLIFLDFGIAGYISEDFEKKLFYLFNNLVNGDLDGTADCLVDIDIGDDEPNIQILKDGIYNVLADNYNQPLKKMPFSKIFYGAVEVARRSKIKFPANFVLFGKSLITLEGTCRLIDPDFNVIINAKPYLKKMVKKRASAKAAFKNVKHMSFQFYQLLNELPGGMKDFLRKFTKIEERIIGIDKSFHLLTNTILRVSKLISLTILFATFFIISMIFIDHSPLLYGFSLFFYLGITASLVILMSLLNLFFKKS